MFSLENRRKSNCEARSAICFVRFCLICGCLFLILGSYGRNIGALSERYGATMGTLGARSEQSRTKITGTITDTIGGAIAMASNRIVCQHRQV